MIAAFRMELIEIAARYKLWKKFLRKQIASTIFSGSDSVLWSAVILLYRILP
jgi:hypothetical protein